MRNISDSVKVRIDGDDSGFKKSLSGIGSAAKKSLGVAVKGITATSAAIGALSVASVKGYADFEQLVGGVETLFGAKGAKNVQEYAQSVNKTVEEVKSEYEGLMESQSMVLDNAKKAYKTAGMSANSYMETVTSFAASLKQSFDDTAEGLKAAGTAADQAILDMADNSNKMGTSLELIQNAYQGFAKQNYTLLDNLKIGYSGTKSEMERLLADAQKLSGVKYDISNLADVYEAIHVIQTEIGITGTTAKEAGTTITGSVNMMLAAWSNLVTGLADKNADIDSLIDNFIESFMVVMDNITPVLEKTLGGIADFISKAADNIIPKLVDIIIKTLPKLAEAGLEIVAALCDAIIDNMDLIVDTVKRIIKVFAQELGETVPILKPVASIMEYLADNIEYVGAAIIGCTAAAKSFQIFTQVTGWLAGANKALGEYNKALLLGTNAVKGSKDALTPLQMLFGVLTGQITLADAAQAKFNLTVLKNPYVAVAAVVIGLVAAIAALCVWLNKESEAEKQHRLAVEENTKAINDHMSAVNERKKAMSETASASMSSMSHTKSLADELLKLADANGKIAEGDQARAEFIMNELNDALGTEYSLVDGQIQKYGELKDSIYDNIEANKLRLLLEAGEAQYTAALAERADVIKAYNDAYAEGADEMAKFTELQQKRIQLEEDLEAAKAKADANPSDRGAAAEVNRLTEALEKAKTAEKDYGEENKTVLNNLWAAAEAMDVNTASISRYEEAMALSKDNVGGALEIMLDYTSTAENGGVATKKFAEGSAEALAQLGDNVREQFTAYQSALKEYATTGSQSAKALVDSTKKELEKAVGDYKVAGGELADNFISGFDIEGKVTKIDLSPALKAISGYEGKAEKLGYDFSDGYASGIIEGQKEIKENTSQIAEGAASELQTTQKSNSPSKVTEELGGFFSEGFAVGIINGKIGVTEAVEKLGNDAILTLKKRLGIKSPSRVMRDEVGKMISAGIAVGIDDGKTEVQKVMEKLNEELLESEKKYQDESARLKNSKLESDKEYLKELKEIAERERKIYDASLKDMQNNRQKMVDMLEQSIDEVIDDVEELEDLQKDLSDGFKDELELFTVKTSVYTDAEGNEIFRDKKAELVDIDKQTQELNEYSDTLNKLKDKTDIPDELFSHIRSMGMEDGKLFTEAILELDDEELQEYIDSWKKYQDATAENAKALTSREAEAVKKGLTDVFGKVPEEFFKYGSNSAAEFGEGFLEQFTLVLEQAKATISATLSGLLPKEITISNPGNTVTNQDNSTTNYYIQASQGESTHQALNAVREYSVLNNLRN